MLRDVINTLEAYRGGQSARGYIKLSSNENPFGVPPAVRRAVRRSIRNSYRYPPADPLALRQKIATLHGLASNWVTIGNGSGELLNIVASAVIEPGYAGIIGAHTFSVYRHVTQLYGGVAVVVKMKGGVLDWQSIKAAVTSQTHIVFLSNPNNPTGSYMRHNDLAALMKALPPRIVVVIDEAYSEFASAKDFGSGEVFLERYPNMVVLHTFSKIHALAGLRVGYALAAPQLTEAFNRIRLPFNANTCAQAAAYAALDNQKWYRRTRQVIIEEREHLQQKLHTLGFSPLSSQANFICLPVKGSAERFSELLKARGILVRALTSFGLPSHVRITIGTPRENRRLLQALQALQTSTHLHS